MKRRPKPSPELLIAGEQLAKLTRKSGDQLAKLRRLFHAFDKTLAAVKRAQAKVRKLASAPLEKGGAA